MVGMSAPGTSSNFEERSIAIVFCEGISFDAAAKVRDVLQPELSVPFDALFNKTLKEQSGTLVTSIEDTFIAFFESAQTAVHFALSLQKTLQERPISSESKVVLPRICIHYSSVLMERTPLGATSLGQRAILALISSFSSERATCESQDRRQRGEFCSAPSAANTRRSRGPLR